MKVGRGGGTHTMPLLACKQAPSEGGNKEFCERSEWNPRANHVFPSSPDRCRLTRLTPLALDLARLARTKPYLSCFLEMTYTHHMNLDGQYVALAIMDTAGEVSKFN